MKRETLLSYAEVRVSLNRFQRFVIASGFTNLADGIALVAWAWIASLLTRDPLLIALVSVALRLPWFVFAVPAGIITDRVDRQHLILSMDVLRFAGFACAGVAVWMALPLGEAPLRGISTPWLYWALLTAALVVGAAEVFRDNAAQTMLPAIVEHAELERANGRLWSVELIGNVLLGPVVGAFLIAWALPVPMFANALAYLVAVVLVWRITGRFKPERQAGAHWHAELREAWQFLRGAPLLLSLALITGFWNLFFHMSHIALVLHVQENLEATVRIYGLVLAGGAIGGIIAGFVGEHIVKALGPMRTAQVSLVVSGPIYLCMAYLPTPLALALVLTVFEFFGVVWNTVSVSYRQRRIPDVLLGRVNALYRMFAWGMMPIGMIASGLLVRMGEGLMPREWALVLPFFAAGLGAIVLGAWGWRALARGFAGGDET